MLDESNPVKEASTEETDLEKENIGNNVTLIDNTDNEVDKQKKEQETVFSFLERKQFIADVTERVRVACELTVGETMKTLKASPNNLGEETVDSVDNDNIEEAKHWAISQKQSCAKKF